MSFDKQVEQQMARVDQMVEKSKRKRKRKVVPVNRELPHRLQQEVERDLRERFF